MLTIYTIGGKGFAQGVGTFFGATLLVAGIGTAAFFSLISCPYIYSFDGEGYHLDAEPLSGAVSRKLEQTDSVVLRHLKPVDGSYRIRQANELQEIQYTDSVALQVIDHPSGSTIIPDDEGAIHAITPSQPPQRVMFTGTRKDITESVAYRDGAAWSRPFDLAAAGESPEPLLDEITATFSRPRDADTMYLRFRGKNTPLSSFVLSQYLKRFDYGFPKALNIFNGLIDMRGRFERRMLREGGHIRVELDAGGEWRTAGKLREIGPAVFRDRLAVVPLQGVGGDTVRVRLTLAQSHWEVDAIQASFSSVEPLLVREVTPASVSGEGSIDQLQTADERYYVANQGDTVEISFPEPPRVPGADRTVVLKIRGYYRPVLPAPQGDHPFHLVKPSRGESLSHFGARLFESVRR